MALYRRGKKKIWTLAHYLPGGRRVYKSLHTTNKQVAELLAAKEIQRLNQGTLPEEFQKRTLSEALDAYLDDCKSRLRENHYWNRQQRLRRLQSKLGRVALRAVTSTQCRNALNSLEAERQWHPKTFNHYRQDLFTFFRWCERQEPPWMSINPARFLITRTLPENKIEYLEQDDLARLIGLLRESWMLPAVALAIYAGLRQGEIRRLEWQDIDFSSKTITVENKGKQLTKSRKFRIIPLSSGLAEILKAQNRSIGKVCKSPNINPAFWEFRKLHRLPSTWNFLVFRHTFGTHMADAGVPLARLREWMGHSDERVTMKYYVGKKHAYDSRIEVFSPKSVVKSVGNT